MTTPRSRRTGGAPHSRMCLVPPRWPFPCALVVTRDVRFRHWACGELRGSNFQILVLDDGLKAVTVVDSDPPQVIVVDHALPWFGVICLLNRVRSDAATNPIPVLLVVSRAAPSFVRACRTLEVTVLSKQPGELKAVLLGPARQSQTARPGVEVGSGCATYQGRP